VRKAVADESAADVMLSADDLSVHQAVERGVRDAGKIDVLVNNAGISDWGLTETFTIEQALGSAFHGNLLRCEVRARSHGGDAALRAFAVRDRLHDDRISAASHGLLRKCCRRGRPGRAADYGALAEIPRKV
jgi:NAD(P)-dependent dehydrogenase (short-subunit alcohol dehydrogenase family)